jgi:hypothetical protein
MDDGCVERGQIAKGLAGAQGIGEGLEAAVAFRARLLLRAFAGGKGKAIGSRIQSDDQRVGVNQFDPGQRRACGFAEIGGDNKCRPAVVRAFPVNDHLAGIVNIDQALSCVNPHEGVMTSHAAFCQEQNLTLAGREHLNLSTTSIRGCETPVSWFKRPADAGLSSRDVLGSRLQWLAH